MICLRTLLTTACLFLAWNSTHAWIQTSWQESIVTTNRKDMPTYYNSQRLVVDRRGIAHVIYVEGTKSTDTLWYARKAGSAWQPESVYTMNHSGRIVSGISACALALDRRSQPHVFTYSSDYAESAPIFEERWAHRSRRIWRQKVIRRSVNKMGGAAMHDPHLAIDGFGRPHVSAYVHAGHGASHRARHRYFDGAKFQIDLLPRPVGKIDSGPSNLFVDRQNIVHFIYDSKLALHRGNADPGYPDSGLYHVAWNGRQWSTPMAIRKRIGPDENNTDYFVLSNGIYVDPRGEIHVTYATHKRKAKSADVYYVVGRGRAWREEHVGRVDFNGGPARVLIRAPRLDRAGQPHFAFGTPHGAVYAWRKTEQWHLEKLDGSLEGFALAPDQHAHLLCSTGSQLIHHSRRIQ